jgi:DnaK suppressor protein
MSLTSGVLANPETNPDLEELANQTHEEWILLSCNRLGFSLLRQIQDALSRIEEGTYGLCQDCGERISHQRLEAVPWAERCVQCQDRRSAEEA